MFVETIVRVIEIMKFRLPQTVFTTLNEMQNAKKENFFAACTAK